MSRTILSCLLQTRVLVVLLPMSANATLITNTTCSVAQGVTQGITTSGVNQCTATLPNVGVASAMSTASVTFPAAVTDPLTVSVNQSIVAIAQISGFVSAEADATVQFVLTSSGPPRMGIVQYAAPNP